jgi:putative thioredoxin
MAGLFGLGRGKESGQAGSQAKTETTSSLLIKDATTASFSADVIAESARQPVLVDFWAPWCEPCKQLAPILEKTVKAAGGKVKLVKMNIDEHPEIPGRLGVRSIPAVIAFQRGQPVDGFMGALPEREVKGFIERLAWPKRKPWPLQATVKARRSSMPRFSPKNPAIPPPWPDWQNSLLLLARSKALRRFWPRLPQAASATLRS